MVSRDVPSVKPGSTSDLEALDTVRMLVESMSEEGACCVPVLHVEHTATRPCQQGSQLCVTAMCTLAWCCLVGNWGVPVATGAAQKLSSRLEIK